MGFVWVASMTFILIFTELGQSDATEVNRCFKECQPGYYKVGTCDNPAAPNQCGKCGPKEYTETKNSITKCLRCNGCNKNEIIIKICASDSDTICDCKEGYYYSKSRICAHCSAVSETSDYNDYKKKCCQWKDCMNHTVCKTNCFPVSFTTTKTPPPTNSSSTTVSVAKETSVSTPEPGKISPDKTSNPAVKPVPHNSNSSMVWFRFVLAVVVSLVLCWFLLLFYRNLFRIQDTYFCCSPTKDLERPAQEADLNEQHSHHSSRQTTLTFSISEETPMMPAFHEPPAHLCGQMAAIQNEQSERWPAIVLYAIIKEVPLRRWKEFLRLLSVSDQEMERVELEAGLGSIEKQYQMLRLWSQRPSVTLSEVYSSLYCMDLLGCAQLLQENLEKLQWEPEPRQGLAA